MLAGGGWTSVTGCRTSRHAHSAQECRRPHAVSGHRAAHLAMCAGAGDDSVPLMTVDTFQRLTGGVRAILDSTQR